MSEADNNPPTAPADPSASFANPQSPIARLPHVPRLSIRYLLAWTAVTAVVLGWMQTQWGNEVRGEMTIFAMMLRILFAAVAGWLLFGTLLIGWHKLRRTGWPLEPGEWLMLVLTNVLTISFAFDLLDRLYGAREQTDHSSAIQVIVEIALVGIMATILVAAGFTLRRRLSWCGLFAVLALSLLWVASPYSYLSGSMMKHIDRVAPGEITAVFLAAAIALRRRPLWCAVMVFPAIGYMSTYLGELEVVRRMELGALFLFMIWNLVLLLATLGLLIAAEVRDRVQRRPRHWLHWSGTITSLLLLLWSITMTTISLIR
ncbi:MAG: hypothetical protein K8T25_19320 [Planctomycetia bacterium]|nr:hypothetical protein [Planctomycetia bacterium]